MKKRIFASKILAVSVIGVTLLSHHAYSDDSAYGMVLELTGYVFLAIAAFGRIWASAFISGKKNTSLVTDGPYSVVRNPLYLFSFFGFIGSGLVFESIVIAFMFGLVFFFTHWPTILKEESKLNDLFGDTFQSYKKKVPRFIPKPWLLKNPKNTTILMPIFSKALFQAAFIMVVYPTAQLVEQAHIHSYLPVFFKLI